MKTIVGEEISMNKRLVIIRSGANNGSIYIYNVYFDFLICSTKGRREWGFLWRRVYVKWGLEYFGGEK